MNMHFLILPLIKTFLLKVYVHMVHVSNLFWKKFLSLFLIYYLGKVLPVRCPSVFLILTSTRIFLPTENDSSVYFLTRPRTVAHGSILDVREES